MKFTARKRSSGSILNLTPLIDCMFLLVIFIMIAARFEPDSGISVDLPKASATESDAPKKPQRINVSIDVDGRIFLGQDEVAADDLERRIVEARTEMGDPEGKDVILVIYGDKDAQHGRVVEVLDAASRAKQEKVTVRTRQ